MRARSYQSGVANLYSHERKETMKGRCRYFILLLVMLLAACGQVGSPEAGEEKASEESLAPLNIGTDGDDFGNDVAVDSSGNVYVVGNIEEFDGDGEPESGGAFIRKYNAKNKFQWEDTFWWDWGSARSVSVDRDGNVYVVGSKQFFDTSTSRIYTKGMIRKYSGSFGDFLGETSFSLYSPHSTYAYGSAVDNDAGLLYVVGQARKPIGDSSGLVGYISAYDLRSWPPFELRSRREITCRTLNYTVNCQGNNTGNVYASDVAVDKDGKAVVVGWFDRWERNGFLLRYSPNSNTPQIMKFDGDNNLYEEPALGVDVDSSGNIYVAGNRRQYDKLKPNGGKVIRRGAYLRKFDASGTEVKETGVWPKPIWDQNHTGKDVAVDSNGNVYLAGDYQVSGSNYDAYVVKYSSRGTQVWRAPRDTKWNPTAREFNSAIAVRPNGKPIYLTGHTTGRIGSARKGGVDAFLVRLNGSGEFVWAP